MSTLCTTACFNFVHNFTKANLIEKLIFYVETLDRAEFGFLAAIRKKYYEIEFNVGTKRIRKITKKIEFKVEINYRFAPTTITPRLANCTFNT